MYQLLLVDDEPLFRRKFSALIPWEDYGFSLCACLSDGKEAMEYLKSHPVDVIFSDIKMTFVSGVELAEYVSRQYPHIKVVLNSGYSEFEYAQKAIAYGVFEYLLKPSKRSEVIACLEKLKQLLDKTKRPPIDGEMHRLLKRQALFDIYSGVLCDESSIQQRLSKIDFSLDFRFIRCACAQLHIDPSTGWKYSKNDLYTALETILADSMSCGISCYTINYTATSLELIFLLTGDESDDALQASLSRAQNAAKEILQCRVFLQHLRSYPSLLALAQASGQEYNLDRLKILFLQYLNSGDQNAALTVARQSANALSLYPLDSARRELTSLFHLIGYVSQHSLEEAQKKIPASNIEELSHLCYQTLSQLVNRSFACGDSYKSGIIDNAKKYIEEHYQEDISLEDVADHVYLNKIYFCRFFKQETGENFNDYLTLVRMNKAMEFLRQPSVKVYEVCELVGYKTPRYFYKLFKKHTGYTPSEYRKHLL